MLWHSLALVELLACSLIYIQHVSFSMITICKGRTRKSDGGHHLSVIEDALVVYKMMATCDGNQMVGIT